MTCGAVLAYRTILDGFPSLFPPSLCYSFRFLQIWTHCFKLSYLLTKGLAWCKKMSERGVLSLVMCNLWILNRQVRGEVHASQNGSGITD